MDKSKIALEIQTDLDLIGREDATERIVELMVTAPAAAVQKERPALNLAIVLDRSGSMSREKLGYAKKAALHLLDLLNEKDRAALVVYDDRIDILSESVPLTPANRTTFRNFLQLVEARGSTNLCGGWLTGCEQAAEAAQDGSLNRALLLTDGLANVGITDPESIAHHAYELAQRGVTTSTFGVGLDYNHRLLEAMSNRGGGSYYFIETPSEIPGIFLREFQELSTATALEVEVSLDIPVEIKVEAPGDWTTERIDRRFRIQLGTMFSGRLQPVYLKLSFPAAGEWGEIPITAWVRAKSEDGSLMEAQAKTVFKSASQAEVDAGKKNTEMLERYAQVVMAEVSSEALRLEQMGEFAKASAMINQSLNANMGFLGETSINEYQLMSNKVLRGLDERERKQSHYDSYSKRRSRED